MKVLNKVGSLLSSLQGNKILEKATKKKDQGFYKTELEFKQALKQNLLDIASNQDKPLYLPKAISPGVAYSEIFNENISDILLDLEVLFGEINFLFSKIKSHEIFFERSVAEAEVLTKKLEQSLEAAKIEASPENAFNKIFHNSFIDASKKVDITNPTAKEVYYDFQRERRLGFDSLCNIDIKKGKISLPKFSEDNIEVAEARILSTESTVSEYDVSFPGNNISNIVNENFSQSWSHAVLTRKPLNEAAKLVIALDFGDLKEYNSITITPNASEPIYLEEIFTVDRLGNRTSLDIASGLVTETKTFAFNKTRSKEVYISFIQDRSKVIPHDPSEPISLAELQRDRSLPLTLNAISGQIDESIKDPSIKSILGIENRAKKEPLLVYYYPFSLNSIQVGNEVFKDEGIYVSKQERFNKLRNLAIYSKDFIPSIEHWQTGEDMLGGSIEYSVVKKDYDSSGRLIKTSNINMLPVNTERVENELLQFGSRDSAALRFRAHKSNGDGSNVEIYRNGELLVRGVDWRFQNTQSSNSSDYMVANGEKQTVIEITQTNQQKENGVYTAKYIPHFISEPEISVTENGVRILENCSLIIPEIVYGQEVSFSDAFVHIMIRNHSRTTVMTPYVEWYRLAGKEE